MTGDAGVSGTIAGRPPTRLAPFVILAGGGIVAAASILGGVAAATGFAMELPPRGAATIFACCITVPLIVAALIGGALTGVPPFRHERRAASRALRWTGIGAAALGLAAGIAFIAGGGAAAAGHAGTAVMGGAILILFQAAGEELFLRGWLQPALRRCWPAAAAIPAAALLFAALHLLAGERSALTLLNLTIGGVAFGLLAERSGGLAAPIGLHAGWNVAEQCVLGLDPNPGIAPFGALLDLDLTGPAAWGGAAEGLNASVAMTGVLILLTGFILSQRRGFRPDSA